MNPAPRILRNGAPLPAARIPAAVRDADRAVREMIGAAERRAAEIVADAEARRDRIRADAAEQGHRDGAARAAALLAAVAAARDRRLAAVEREVAAVAIDVARAVLGAEVASRGDAVVDLAARALGVARARRQVTLRVHPDDGRAVRAGEGRLAAILSRAPLAIRDDPAVAPGGVAVETEAGWIDGRVEAQLAELERALDEELP